MSRARHFARDRVENSDGEQRQPDDKQAGHRAAVKGDAQSCRARLRRGLGRAHIGQHRDPHSDKTGRERASGADDKTNRRRVILKEKKQEENDDRDDADRDDLPIQICLGAFLHGAGDFTHALVSRRLAKNCSDKEKRENQARHGARDGEHYAGIEHR